MVGSAEDRLEVLNRLIEEGEQYRDEQVALVETQTQCGQDATAAEAELREVEDALTGLRTRAAAFASDPRHS